MSPLQISAQFAAFLWYTNQPENVGKAAIDAHQFARLNWERFLPNAHEGLGKLLRRITTPPRELRSRKPTARRRSAHAA